MRVQGHVESEAKKIIPADSDNAVPYGISIVSFTSIIAQHIVPLGKVPQFVYKMQSKVHLEVMQRCRA